MVLTARAVSQTVHVQLAVQAMLYKTVSVHRTAHQVRSSTISTVSQHAACAQSVATNALKKILAQTAGLPSSRLQVKNQL